MDGEAAVERESSCYYTCAALGAACGMDILGRAADAPRTGELLSNRRMPNTEEVYALKLRARLVLPPKFHGPESKITSLFAPRRRRRTSRPTSTEFLVSSVSSAGGSSSLTNHRAGSVYRERGLQLMHMLACVRACSAAWHLLDLALKLLRPLQAADRV